MAVAAEQQTATTNSINDNIHRITRVVQETAAVAQESASASSHVTGFAEDLRKLVGQFKLISNTWSVSGLLVICHNLSRSML